MSRQTSVALRLAPLLTLGFMLVACGQKGPLYLEATRDGTPRKAAPHAAASAAPQPSNPASAPR